MGYLKALSRHLHMEADDNNGNPMNSLSPRQDLNSVSPKYEVGMLPTQPQRSYDNSKVRKTKVLQVSRVRFPMRSLDFSIDLILPAVVWP
jgi:hypothetical protein